MCQKLKLLRRLEVCYQCNELTSVCILRQLEHLEELRLYNPYSEITDSLEMKDFNKTFTQLLPNLKIFNGRQFGTENYHNYQLDLSNVLVRTPCALEECCVELNTNKDM